jgi:hypothetical protein
MNFKIKVIFWLVIISGAVLICAVLFAAQKPRQNRQSKYYAVFLDNSQVYFGKLQELNREFWKLSDVYYLRAGLVQMPAGETGQPMALGTPQIDLVKLGAELHAPKDEMLINRSHVIFYEEIGENGEIMKLIKQHEGQE